MPRDRYEELDFTDAETLSMRRREFLQLTGGGILVLFTVGDGASLAQERMARQSLPSDFNAFLRIGEDGRVSCYTGKIEMGQGVITSLAQMLADELDVPIESVSVVLGDTDLCPWDMGTFGSRSTRFFGPPLRAAGAEARQVLLELASEQLGIQPAELRTENGAVISSTGRRVTYADLAKGKKIARHVKNPPTVKKPSEFKIMNKPILRADAQEKVTGKALYAGDVRVPGMLYARILRPPSPASKLVRVDLSEAGKVEDVRIVREGDFIAVLHQYPDVAEMARSKIKATYDTPPSDLNDDTIFDHLLKVAGKGDVAAEGGNIATGEHESSAVIEQTYLDGYKAHAPVEPHTALVAVEGKKATVWASTQTPFRAKDEAAKELGLPADAVRVITPFVGGGFGGKTRNLQVVEAARCARLSGKPVQVAWLRKEEFFYDSFRPAAIVKIRSGVNDSGGIRLWDYHVYYAGERGAQQFYSVPNHRTSVHGSGWEGSTNTHPFATGAWRAPANNTNTFARESQIDMMAAKAGIDPVDFRLKNLTDEKMRNVLTTAAAKFGWTAARAPSGRGFGVACGIDAGTSVATMAEVAVDRATGAVEVKRVVCVQDMGLAINPEGAAIQMEGCITMGLGYALKENVRFKGGEVLDENFDSYEVPRFSWLPKIETFIIDAKDAEPQGGGEPAIITMGGVIANAIFDAVGARVTRLPLTPERIKAALSQG